MPEQIWPKASAASMAYSGALARSPRVIMPQELATVLHRQAADLFPGHFSAAAAKLMSAPTVTTRPVIMWRTGTFSGFRSGATPEDDVPVCNHPADFPVFVANWQRTHIVPGQHSGGHGCWLFGADPDDPGVITSFTFI